MKFLVLSRYNIEKGLWLSGIEEPYIIISVTDPDRMDADIPNNPLCCGILRLKFWDLINIYNENYHRLFNLDDAVAIKIFVDKHDVGYIICQCEAGISRSAAIAAALCKRFNINNDFFSSPYNPNMLVYDTLVSLQK